MKISDDGIDFLIAQEGFENTVYEDSAGNPTIGVGHLIKDGEEFAQPLTDAEVEELLKQDLEPVESAINKYFTKFPLTQNAYDALCSLFFNIGYDRIKTSSVFRFWQQGHYEDAADAFLLWNKERRNGALVPSKGLYARRQRERELFLRDA
jgi:lysozyme